MIEKWKWCFRVVEPKVTVEKDRERSRRGVYFTREVEHMKTMKLVKKALVEKWKWISRVGKGKSHSWKGVKEREREGSISPEKWTCQRESGGGRGNGRARNGSAEQKTHFVFWHLAAFSFFQSSVNAQSKVLCDWASSHRHKHSSCLEGYSLWLKILTVFLAIKTIKGFGHKSSYWWWQPNFQCVSVCIFLCMSVGMQYMCARLLTKLNTLVIYLNCKITSTVRCWLDEKLYSLEQ